MTERTRPAPFGVDAPSERAALDAYVKLLRATRAIVTRVEKRLAEHDLTTTQLGVLEGILHRGQLTHRELGRKVLTSAGNMTDVIDKLQSRGLVRRERDTADRRVVRVDLTTEGRRLIETLFPLHARDIATAMSGLPAADLAALSALLRTLGTHAEATAGPCEPESDATSD